MLRTEYKPALYDSITGAYLNRKSGCITTGFKVIDEKLNGGLRNGCCYLFTGIEKSGKSTFLLNMITSRISDSKPTGYISTEMGFDVVMDKILNIYGLTGGVDLENNKYIMREIEKNLDFVGRQDLVKPDQRKFLKFDFELFLKTIDEMVNKGIDLIIVDNLTTLGAEAKDYQVLGSYVSSLMTHMEKKPAALIFVIHVKQTTSYKDKPEKVREMIKAGKAKDIFTESITIVSRPTLADVYGGGQALSQISGGTIMLWRPFQKYSLPSFQKMGMLIVDSHRFGSSCDIPVEFDGVSSKFWTIS